MTIQLVRKDVAFDEISLAPSATISKLIMVVTFANLPI
jgi:hypothetical protein